MKEIADIHKPLMKFLRANRLPYVNHRSDTKSGIQSGWPDFSIFLAGRCLFLEAKTEKGTISPKQAECIAHLKGAGNRVEIVRSAEEAISAVRAWAGIENEAGGHSGAENGHPDKDLSGGVEGTRIRSERQQGASLDTSRDEIVADLPLSASPHSENQASPAQNLFIGIVGGVDVVLSGTGLPGSAASIMRRATASDLANLPRR